MSEGLMLMSLLGIVVTIFWVVLVSAAAWNTLDLQKQIDRVSSRSSERNNNLRLELVTIEQRLIELEKIR